MKEGQTSIGGNEDKAALLSITLITIVSTILVWPTDDIPLIDDWTYAWSVKHVLETCELRVLDWSAHYPFTQIIWGALFSHFLGFSFFTLRVSTLVLCWLGLIAFFLTLRKLSISPLFSTLGTLAFFFNPVMFVLSNTFMTDVPFVSLMNVAILWYVLWVRNRSSLYLGLGGVFAIACFLTRQIGAGLALIPLIYLLQSRFLGSDRYRFSWRQLFCLLFPFLVIGLVLWWIREIHGVTSVYLEKSLAFRYFFSTSGWVYFWGLAYMLVQLGFILWPLALGSLSGGSRSRLALSLTLVVLVLGVHLWQFGDFPTLLTFGETFSFEELGNSQLF